MDLDDVAADAEFYNEKEPAAALPNASKIGFTGTPIDKTERVFGDYIDKYTMRQSIDDGVTLEIVYEGRTHNAEVADQVAMDTVFADVFSEYNLRERLEILGYGSRDAYLEAKATIKAKALDMVGPPDRSEPYS